MDLFATIKSGKITCKIPNSRPSNRGAIYVVCFKNIKKLSNCSCNNDYR